jgi:hypothetical protein
MFAKQVLYLLSHNSNPFLEMSLMNYLPRLALTKILLISAF